ncbi:hypothetical protein [Pseudomonas fluorescens]|uniref:hypothetical protein n=1 Tax=Pseudomonas fluorescens TaxID=294 RepID=UPI0009367C3B|nr:hypothetical protein [Pseudomonas fluorescens]
MNSQNTQRCKDYLAQHPLNSQQPNTKTTGSAQSTFSYATTLNTDQVLLENSGDLSLIRVFFELDADGQSYHSELSILSAGEPFKTGIFDLYEHPNIVIFSVFSSYVHAQINSGHLCLVVDDKKIEGIVLGGSTITKADYHVNAHFNLTKP